MTQTQKERVIDQLVITGEVNNLWAIENHIWRLGAIIHSLKKEGWNIAPAKMINKVAYYDLVNAPIKEQIPIIGEDNG